VAAARRLLSSAISPSTGTRPVIEILLGAGAPGDERREICRVEPDLAIEMRALLGALPFGARVGSAVPTPIMLQTPIGQPLTSRP